MIKSTLSYFGKYSPVIPHLSQAFELLLSSLQILFNLINCDKKIQREFGLKLGERKKKGV